VLNNRKYLPVKSLSARNRPTLLLPLLDRCCRSLLGDSVLGQDKPTLLFLVLLLVLKACLCLLGDAELTVGLRFLALLPLHDLERGLPLEGDARGMQLLDLCLLLSFNLESDLPLLGEADFGNVTRFSGAPLLFPACNICCLLPNESKLDGNMLYWVKRLLSCRALSAPMAWPWDSELAGDVLGLCKLPLLGLELDRPLPFGVSEPVSLDLTPFVPADSDLAGLLH
jgi:hypothetical protein